MTFNVEIDYFGERSPIAVFGEILLHSTQRTCMAIYNINDFRKKEPDNEPKKVPKIDYKAFYSRFESLKKQTDKPGIISSLLVRGFFLLLIFIDALWMVYSLTLMLLCFILKVICFGRVAVFNHYFQIEFKNLTRGSVCLVALLIALFNPALGIMFSCLYFMMYDRSGIEEIVPISLREQFKEYFPQ